MALEPLGSAWIPLLAQARARLAAQMVRGESCDSGPKDAETDAALAAYLDEVVLWNRRTDLTAARTPEELVDLSFADAWVMAAVSSAGGSWVDVGSGAG